MTTRGFGFVALKLMGLFYLNDAVFSFVNMVGLLSASRSDAWPEAPPSFAATSLAAVVIYASLAFICLFLTDTLASWLFDDEPRSGLSLDAPVRLLEVGVILVGVFLFAGNLAPSVRFAVELFLNLEGSRQSTVGDFLAFSWRDALASIGSGIVGAFLMLRGDLIARRLSPIPEVEVSSDEVVPSDMLGRYRLFAYRVARQVHRGGARFDISLPPDVQPERIPSDFVVRGFDAVSRSIDCTAALEHSPLSCNHLAAELDVNEFCLFPSLDAALAGADAFSVDQPEPGEYCVVQVLEAPQAAIADRNAA